MAKFKFIEQGITMNERFHGLDDEVTKFEKEGYRVLNAGIHDTRPNIAWVVMIKDDTN